MLRILDINYGEELIFFIFFLFQKLFVQNEKNCFKLAEKKSFTPAIFYRILFKEQKTWILLCYFDCYFQYRVVKLSV